MEQLQKEYLQVVELGSEQQQEAAGLELEQLPEAVGLKHWLAAVVVRSTAVVRQLVLWIQQHAIAQDGIVVSPEK